MSTPLYTGTIEQKQGAVLHYRLTCIEADSLGTDALFAWELLEELVAPPEDADPRVLAKKYIRRVQLGPVDNGKVVRIFDAHLQSGNNSAPAGQVTGVGAEEITVALNGGALTVKKARGEGAKVSGAEFVKQVDLKIGDRLELVPGYGDLTTVLHNQFFVLKDNKLVDIWPLTARDCFRRLSPRVCARISARRARRQR